MYQKDYILRLIEEFTKVLGAMLGLKNAGNYVEAQELINETLKRFSKTDISELLSIPEHELLPFLTDQKKLSEEQIHIIAELLFQDAGIIKSKNPDADTNLHYRTSLVLFEWLNVNNRTTYSIEITQRIALLRDLITKI
jgi:hypothetical protein